MTRKKRVLAVLLCILLGTLAWADAYASIVYAEGNTFRLTRSGAVRVYNTGTDDVLGLEIKPGDLIQTSGGTWLEVSIHHLSASVQVAENTTFRFEADEKRENSSGDLLYGRVRAKVGRLSGSSSYKIKTPTLIAGVRGTDFGCDVIAFSGQTESGVLNRVFCFEGSVAVNDIAHLQSDPVMITTNEMVEVSGEATAQKREAPLIIEKTDVADEVRIFWLEKPSIGYVALDSLFKLKSTSMLSGGKEDSVSAVVPEPPPSRVINGMFVADQVWPTVRAQTPRRNLRVPNRAAAALVIVGSALCLTASYLSSERDFSRVFVSPSHGGGLILVGTGSLLALLSHSVSD